MGGRAGHKRGVERGRDLGLKDGERLHVRAHERGVVAQLLPRDVRRRGQVHDVAHGLRRDVLLAHTHGGGGLGRVRCHRPSRQVNGQRKKRQQKKKQCTGGFGFGFGVDG